MHNYSQGSIIDDISPSYESTKKKERDRGRGVGVRLVRERRGLVSGLLVVV